MAVIERNTGGNWDSDRHPHEPKIKRQLASNGACFICELMEETRIAEQRLGGAVSLDINESEVTAALAAWESVQDRPMGDRQAMFHAIRAFLLARGGQ